MSVAPLYCVIGAGYSGRRIASALTSRGHEVVITHRKAPDHPTDGPQILPLDLDSAGPIPFPDRPLAIMYLVPPAAERPDPRLRRLLDELPAVVNRFVLASTSGVYGDCGGALIDETAATNPQTERARRRVSQERLLTDWALDNSVPYAILRIAGIYGPGRLPTAAILANEPVIAANDAHPGNRIHVDDLAAVAVAALIGTEASGIFNVADGNDTSTTDFYHRVARLAGLKAPPEVDRETARRQFSEIRYSFLTESRRLSTARLRDDLGVNLRYGDLDAGIRASIAEERETTAPGSQ